MMPRTMARKTRTSTGSLARNLAISCAVAGLIGGLFVAVAVVQNVASSTDDSSKAWQVGISLAVLCGVITGGAAWSFGGKVVTRLTHIQLAFSNH